MDRLSLSLAVFYNQYRDLRSVDTNPSAPPSFMIANNHRAESRGVELSGTYQPTTWWQLRGGYTKLDESVRATQPGVIPSSTAFEIDDPNDQFLLQSMMDLPGHVQLDLIPRYVAALPYFAVRSYVTTDARLAWQFQKLELSLVGQNLGDNRRSEFSNLEIPRSVYSKIALRW